MRSVGRLSSELVDVASDGSLAPRTRTVSPDVPAPVRIVFNGKFLSAAPTGVHRVADEIVHAVDELLAERDALADRFEFELLTPPDVLRCPVLRRIRVRSCGRFTRRAWEQYDLPRHAAGRTVVSLCNLGPVVLRNAITMIHDAQVYSAPTSYGWAFRLWYRLVQPVLGRRHRAVLTVSEFSKRELARFGVTRPGKIRVVLNGADHMRRIVPAGSARARHRLLDAPYVMAPASLQAHKNVKVLLRAFSSARAGGLRLVLYGPAARADFERAGLAVPGSVRFVGRIDDEDMSALLRGAHCLAFPSLTEGFGLPPLEAMWVGCPVVAAPRGAVPEVCGDAALYAEPDDPEAWWRAFDALRTDPALRERLVADGLARSRLFTWRRAGEATLEVLAESGRG